MNELVDMTITSDVKSPSLVMLRVTFTSDVKSFFQLVKLKAYIINNYIF